MALFVPDFDPESEHGSNPVPAFNNNASTDPTPEFFDYPTGYGAYFNIPPHPPQIHLNRLLLLQNKDCTLLDMVYQALLDYHRSIPLDSFERVRPFIRYYEELQPVEVEAPALPRFKHPHLHSQARGNLYIVGRAMLPEEAVMMLSTFTRSPGSDSPRITAWRVKVRNKFRLIG
jgi:hypothetical protein